MNLSKKDNPKFIFSKIAKKALSLLLCITSLAACSKNAKANGVNSQPGDFYVISCDPAGKLPSEVRFPSIYVQFSEPVVALEKLGEQSDKSDVFSIEPKIDGVFRWYGTSLLAFECADAVVPQMEYKVKVNGNLKSINGTQLTGETEYTFTTEELKITNFVPGYSARKEENTISSEDYYDYYYSSYGNLNDLDLTSAADLAVFFNYPVNASVTGSFIELRDETGKVYKTEASAIEGENALLVKVKDTMPENTGFQLVLKEGACSEKGFLGKSEEQIKEFHTLKPFTFNYADSDRRSYGKYSNPVFLYFSHRIDPNAAEWVSKNVTTKPSMPVSAENVSISGNSVMIHSLPVNFEQTYTLSLAAGLKDAYGRATTSSEEIEVTVPSAASMATFKDYGHGILEAQFEPKLAFQYQNILDGSCYSVNGEIVKYDESNVPKNTRVTEVVDLAPYLKKIKDRYFGHVNFSANIVVKDNYDRDYTYTHNNSQVIQVTNLGATVRYAYNKAVIMVNYLDTGKPVANADVAFLVVPGNNNSWIASMETILNEVSMFDKDYRGYDFTPMGIARTDANGLAVIDFAETEKFSTLADKRGAPITLGDIMGGDRRYGYTPIIEVSCEGDRLVFNPDITYMWSTGANYCRDATHGDAQITKTFLFTDRGLYKPGEKLSFRGVDRDLKLSQYSAYTGAYTLTVRESRWQGKEIYNTKGTCTKNGSFWGSIRLPQDLEPGSYEIVYERAGTNERMYEYFTVAYFERLRFSASASIADQTYVRGDRVDATVNAEYLGGGSLGGCNFTASWFREPTYFRISKPEFAEWRFGPVQGYDNRSFLGRETGVLGSNGSGSVSTTSGSEQLKGMAYQYRTEMRVSDSAGQEISASASTVVHPAAFYIGLSPAKNLAGFATKGKELDFDFKLVQPNGNAPLDDQLPAKKADKKIKLELLRENWKIVQQMGIGGTINTRYVKEMVNEITRDIDLQNAGSFNFTVPKGGAYILRLSTTDRKGNDVVTERRFYASGSEWRYFGNQSEEIKLICDKDEYAEGDTAKIMLQSPIEKGTYLITVERDSIISQEVRTFDQSVSIIDLPVKAEYLPVVYVTVSSFSLRSGEPAEDYDSPDLNKPKGYFGVAPVHVNTEGKSMDLAISTDKPSYKPGEKATVSLKVSRGGVPVEGAELSFMAVDRGVIDLIDYHVPDPMKFFYSESCFPLSCNGGDSRSLLIDPVRYAAKNLFGGDAESDDDKMNERKNFDPTAIFEPCIITDANGIAKAEFNWPDTLTTYRMTAFGVKDDHFAVKESEINVANPISVREVLPRRLRVGDISEAGVVISNLEASAQNVTVSMEVFEGIEKSGQPAEVDGIVKQPGFARMIGKTEETVKVGANTTLPVMFPFEAQNDGFITVQFTVKSSLVNERILKPLQIDRPIIYETVVTTGETGDDKQAFAKEQVKLPQVFDKSYGTLSLTLDATRLGVLKEAVNYCFRYPYGCLEQRSSAILPLVLFSDYIKAFDLNSEVKNPKKVIEKEIKDWGKYQKSSGAFPYWPSGYYESLPVTLRIAEIVGIAQSKGYSTNAINTRSLFQYIEAQIDAELAKEHPNTAMLAYASYVLTGFESKNLKQLYAESEVIKDALTMVEKAEKASISDMCFAALAYKKLNNNVKALDLLKQVQGYFKPTTRGLDITDPARCSYWYWFGGNSDAYSAALKAYSVINPESDYLGRLVFELLQIQKASRGYWRSTASTARVLDGFATYIEALNLEKTDFTAESLIAGKSVEVNKFKGLGAEPVTKTFAFNDKAFDGIAENTAFDVEFSKKGTGNLFYTMVLKYPLWANEMTARDEGLCVFMEYVDIETGKTVAADKLESGKTYKAKVMVSSTKDRTFVALRAPIPAGCEVLNAAFVTTGTYSDYAEETKESSDDYYDDYYYYDDDYGYSFNMLSNQTIYDNEVQYFWDDFPRGRQSVDFLFRAVRKGTYQTPSATVECMYEPEIFGRSAGKVWKVE